jgi:hypothetical protein
MNETNATPSQALFNKRPQEQGKGPLDNFGEPIQITYDSGLDFASKNPELINEAREKLKD